jgi:hypothetical protein
MESKTTLISAVCNYSISIVNNTVVVKIQHPEFLVKTQIGYDFSLIPESDEITHELTAGDAIEYIEVTDHTEELEIYDFNI